MNGDLVLTWLLQRTDTATLAAIAAAVLASVQAAKVLWRRIPRLPQDFSDWWLVGGLVGIALGLGLVEWSVAGAVVGLLEAILATGAFEFLSRGGSRLGRQASAGLPSQGGAPRKNLPARSAGAPFVAPPRIPPQRGLWPAEATRPAPGDPGARPTG